MTKNRESARLVMHEVSEPWRIPTLFDKCIAGDFSSEQFASAFQLLKSGKDPDPDSIYRCCPEILAKQVSLFLHAPTQASSNLEKSISGCYPKA